MENQYKQSQRIILENKRIPDDVLDDQIKYFEVPTKDEDFDILENIKNIWGKVYICNGVTDK